MGSISASYRAADLPRNLGTRRSDVRPRRGVTKGGNYGWHIKEGTHCFSPKTPSSPPATCPSTGPHAEPLLDPVIEYNHTEILGSVVIGGYIYRGKAVPYLDGMYVFGDYSRNRIKPDGTLFAGEPDSGKLWKITELEAHMPDDPDPGPGFGRFVIAFGQATTTRCTSASPAAAVRKEPAVPCTVSLPSPACAGKAATAAGRGRSSAEQRR